MRGQIACPAHWKAMPPEDRWRIAYLPRKQQQPALRETLQRLGLWTPSLSPVPVAVTRKVAAARIPAPVVGRPAREIQPP